MSMSIEGAYNILSDPAITESSELPIAVRALVALALANRPNRDLQCKIKPRECECFWYQVCPKCHWAKHITGCDCSEAPKPRKSYWEEGTRLRSKLGGQMGTLVFVDGHPGVRRDGDSYASHLIVGEWEPV